MEYNEMPDRLRKKINKLINDETEQAGRTWKYYEEMRKTDKTKYWKPETQVQMHKDAEELGDAFGFGD